MGILFACPVLIIALAGSLLAQVRVIDEGDYQSQMRKASEYRLKENYRAVRTTEFCETANCVWKPMSIDVMEFDNPGKRRSHFVDTQRGMTKPSSLWIFIDDTVYVKREGMDWVVERQPRMEAARPSTTMKLEFEDLGVERSGLEEMRVLLKRTRWSASDRPDGRHMQTIKSWIGRDGRLKKEEYVITTSGGRSTRLRMSYEVDPTIRIEAPIK